MNIDELITQITRQLHGRHQNDARLVVEVYRPGSIGGTPCVEVAGVFAGFDWDSGKFILKTDEKLTTLTPEQVAEIHESAMGGQSWHAYQTYKKQADRIKELEAQLNKK